MPNVNTLLLIGLEFWKDQGRTDEEIKAVLATDAGRRAFLKPAYGIYKKLKGLA